MMGELIKSFNSGTVLLKNVAAVFGFVVLAVAFYINTSSHVDNTGIHVDQQLKMKTEIRILTIENELLTLSNRMNTRHERITKLQTEATKEYHLVLTKVLDLLTAIEKNQD